VTQQRRTEPLPLGAEAGLPYSKGVLARALMSTGVPAPRAYELAVRVERELAGEGLLAVAPERLDELALETFGGEEGGRIVDRLRRFRTLWELELPVIVLIGGATGTGKSTVASEVAYRLGITRVTSTDFIRQTMRAFFSREFMPTIHYSSFDAAQALREPERAQDPQLAGFLDQTRNVLGGVHAAIDRALEEGWSMVLEGVHLVPGLAHLPHDRALVVECVLALDDPEVHAEHFYLRDLTSEERRPVEKYLSRLDDIRRIQTAIVERALRAQARVSSTGSGDEAVGEVIELVLSAAEASQSRVEP
jgi:2-phosphoglycerate kinase